MIEIKDCNSCVYQCLCKFRKEREEILNYIDTGITDILGKMPGWVKQYAGNSHIGCEDYKSIRTASTNYCGNCKHCVKTAERTGRGYMGHRCEIIQERKPFGFSRVACEKFEQYKV